MKQSDMIKYAFAMIAITALLLSIFLVFDNCNLCIKYCNDVYGVDAAYRIGYCACIFTNMDLPFKEVTNVTR